MSTPGTIDDAFPSKYLKASDLPEEGTQAFTIEKVDIEEVGREKQRKPVLHFEDSDKSMVANKTNCNTIAKQTGSRSFEDWTGTTIHLHRADVEFGGEMVESIRVKIKPAKGSKSVDMNQPKSTDEDSDIPF